MASLSFFLHNNGTVYVVTHLASFSHEEKDALSWLFDGAVAVPEGQLCGNYIGPRPEMITPWSTNAVEITQNMGISGISRIEFFKPANSQTLYDPMLLHKYDGLNAHVFDLDMEVKPIELIEDIEAYNDKEGLALSPEEITYLKQVAKELNRPLTDSELFGFSQVNSEHCRHKIFGGTFIIDGEEQPQSLFSLIKETSQKNPKHLVSAYKDNVAFNQGPKAEFFSPEDPRKPSYFGVKEVETVLSLKAETHNFPTTVEPFNGAATGSGGEIRDRLAGGCASLPLAGTAVYMTSYPRLDQQQPWETLVSARPWIYQSPQQILTKASNGASDFGNKFGQPLICGSLLTFEHQENEKLWGYDKVIMLAGGVGMAQRRDALKGHGEPGEKVIVMGGDNYRIGMGGGAVSSVNTGEYQNAIELNAVQRSNPEMQKRVANVIRALAEGDSNPVVSIHDHGAGGHLNCLSELVEETGGCIHMDKLPIGDATLSAKEIIGNESQERMGLLMKPADVDYVREIAERERAPFYVVGETTNDMRLTFKAEKGENPLDLQLKHLFGNSPKTVMRDVTRKHTYSDPVLAPNSLDNIAQHLRNVLRLEAVGSKDWLTNKVDRSVTGKVAQQQCVGELQLPLADFGAVSLDYRGNNGIATAIGHAPQVALINPAKGSRIAIAEALTNLLGAPLKKGLDAVSLSANWMWPCRNEGEDAALYRAVKACSEFAIKIGVNIPTGKDSLSMTQKYRNGQQVLSPGTVIISAAGEIGNVRKVVTPTIKQATTSGLVHIDLSGDALKLGGSALYQTMGKLGNDAPDILDPDYFVRAYNKVSELVTNGKVLAIHDISAGGLLTTVAEMAMPNINGGVMLDFRNCTKEVLPLLFAENPGVVIQVAATEPVLQELAQSGVKAQVIGSPIKSNNLTIYYGDDEVSVPMQQVREWWYTPSARLEPFQVPDAIASERKQNLFKQPVKTVFPTGFTGALAEINANPNRKDKSGIVAAIIRDKGTNGEREMAYALHLAGFDVRDVHMSDLRDGKEDLHDVRLIVFCGGFSNSDVLGSAKGWAAGFLYNEKAKKALENFYNRPDTLSLGICNGCQLMAELGVLYPEHEQKHRMLENCSGKFESEYVSLTIPQNNCVFLDGLENSQVGIWVAHGEGRFHLPYSPDSYCIGARYSYSGYPGNPNGSPDDIAAIYSKNGQHLAMMPHPERAIFPWQCGYYPETDTHHEVTPWMRIFANAFAWCRKTK